MLQSREFDFAFQIPKIPKCKCPMSNVTFCKNCFDCDINVTYFRTTAEICYNRGFCALHLRVAKTSN